MEQDQTAKLGIFKQNHINLLSQTKLVPLETLFSVSNYGLLQQGGHSRSFFYAESWALIHYLIQTGKSAGLSKFLLSTMKNTPSAQVFQDSFQMSYAQMEKELSKYVSQNSYKYQIIDFKNKLLFASDRSQGVRFLKEKNQTTGREYVGIWAADKIDNFNVSIH